MKVNETNPTFMKKISNVETHTHYLAAVFVCFRNVHSWLKLVVETCMLPEKMHSNVSNSCLFGRYVLSFSMLSGGLSRAVTCTDLEFFFS